MIQVSGLTKDYGARRALDNISFMRIKGRSLASSGPTVPARQPPCES